MRDLQSVVHILQDATSLSSQTQRQSMETLNLLADQQGLIPALVHILNNQHISPTVDSRLLAVITIKNIVNTNWKSIAVEEKKLLHHFTTSFYPRDKKISLQLILLASIIACKDWPNNWPELFNVLMDKVQRVSSTTGEVNEWYVQVHSMQTLKKIVDELNKKCLPLMKNNCTQLMVQLFPLIANNVWIELGQTIKLLLCPLPGDTATTTAAISDFAHNHSVTIEQLLQHFHTTTSILSKTLCRGYVQLHKLPDIGSFFDIYIALYKDYCRYLIAAGGCRTDINQHDSCGEDSSDDYIPNADITSLSMRKIIKKMSFIPVNLLLSHPMELIPMLHAFLHFFYHEIVEYTSTSNELLLLSSVLFLSHTLSSISGYDLASIDEDDDCDTATATATATAAATTTAATNGNTYTLKELATTGNKIRGSFFTDTVVTDLMKALLTSLLHANYYELHEWSTDPEQYYSYLEAATINDSLRCASEQLYLGIAHLNEDLVCSILMSLLTDIPRQMKAVTSTVVAVGTDGGVEGLDSEIMLWDAVYLCTGLSASVLAKRLEANNWLTTCIGPVLMQLLSNRNFGTHSSGGQQILRRRIMWMLSCWIYSFDIYILPQLLSMLTSVCETSSSSDVVTTLEAVQTISCILLHQYFQPEMLTPVLVNLIEALCTLTTLLVEGSSQAKVVELIKNLIAATGGRIKPLLLPIATHIFGLWNSSNDSNSLIRTSLLVALKEVAKAAGSDSNLLYPITLPLIGHSLGIQLPVTHTLASSATSCSSSNYLINEGMELWVCVARSIQASYQCTPELLTLFNVGLASAIASEFIDFSNMDTVINVMLVIEAYAAADGNRGAFLVSASNVLQVIYTRLVGNVAARIVPYITRPIEVMFLTCPAETSTFITLSGVLLSMIRSCIAVLPMCAKYMTSYEEPDVVCTCYLSIVARLILLRYYDTLNDAITYLVVNEMDSTMHPDDVMNGLIRLCIDSFDTVGYRSAGSWHRKLWCLSLLSLYPSSNAAVNDWFWEVVNMTVDVVSEEESVEGQAKATSIVKALVATSLDDEYLDTLDTVDDDNADECIQTMEDEPIVVNMTALISNDTVANVSITAAVSQKLQEVCHHIGEVAFNEVIHRAGLADVVQRLLNLQTATKI